MADGGMPSVPAPVPRPRTSRTPVPLPRTFVPPDPPDRKDSVEQHNSGLQHSKSFVHNTQSLKKSLKRVKSNVQESTRNMGSKLESSVRNMLSKRQSSVSETPEVKDDNKENLEENKRSQSLPAEDVFQTIKFGSPLASEDIYEETDTVGSRPPPAYPPPPLPDESLYDHIQSARSSVSDFSSIGNRTYYEEVPILAKLNLPGTSDASSEMSSSGGASSLPEPEKERTSRSNSWNFYEPAHGTNLVKVPGPFYENVAIDDSYTIVSENIYSDEPAPSTVKNNTKPRVVLQPVKPQPPERYAQIDEVDKAHEYENCLVSLPKRPESSKASSIDSTENVPKISRAVIYEFDPLFEERKKKKEAEERRKREEEAAAAAPVKHLPEVEDFEFEDFHEVDIYNIPTPPERVDSLPEGNENPAFSNDVEYFLYHRIAGESSFLVVDELPRGASSQKDERRFSNLVRWTNVKRALNKIVSDGAPWTPGLARKNSKAKELGQKLMCSQSPHQGYLLRSISGGDKPKDFVQKWCYLGEGKLTLSQEKNSSSKEIIPLENILSIHNVLDPKFSEDSTVHCWEVSVTGKSKPVVFGASSSADSKMWMRKLLESLTNVFPTKLSAEYCRAGQCFLKEGVTDDWTGAWILLSKRVLYYCQMKERVKEIDLRKTRLVVLQTDDDGSCKTVSEQGPYIQVHTIDKVLYLQMDVARESKAWKQAIKMAAMESGPSLEEQQLTKDDVPVIVDKCLNFIYAHGSMSEGIYRRSGGNANVNRLTALMRADAWSVQLSRQEYTEHDVSSVLKRFFRELTDTLLTALLHKYFCKAGCSKCSINEKVGMYRTILEKLPRINYVTARRLFGHLAFIAEQSEKNRMPSDNLAAIWAPTLMSIEGKRGVEWSKKECEVVKDLIENYKAIFLVDCEEDDREKRILEVLQRVQTSPNIPPPKPSGDLKISVFLRAKRGESVSVAVGPAMEAGQICSLLASKTEYGAHELCLHEMVLGGALSRPIHHSEKVLDIALRWAYWDAADCKDNYFLLALNSVYREIIPQAKPPMSKCGELKFADQKTKSFKSFMFEFSQAKLKYYKDKACSVKLKEWKVEDITWYIGHEPKRNPQTRWAITFINRDDSLKRTKDKPFFGNTIAGTSKEDQVQWMAALLLGQFQHTDLLPKPILI